MATAAKSASRTALEETSKDGAFERKASTYRHWIKKGSRFAPESGRYHLYVSLACPWASRAVAVLNLKGLQDVVGLSVTHPTWQRTRPDDPEDRHSGWAFFRPDDPPVSNAEGHGSFPCDGCVVDTLHGVKFVRDLYDMANDTSGKYTVPVLWDKKEETIVNNESSEIIRMLNSEFNDFAAHPDIDLYPEELRSEIDSVNEWVYPSINNGVYRCGFATKQEAYEKSFEELFEGLERAEDILNKQRYLCGNKLTEADIRLFVTLIRFGRLYCSSSSSDLLQHTRFNAQALTLNVCTARYHILGKFEITQMEDPIYHTCCYCCIADPVYVVYFKTDHKCIREYPSLREYTKELYQTPGIRESVNINHIKRHYFTSHPKLNPYAIIPGGPKPWWEEPHTRGG